MRNELGEPFALLPWRSEARIWISEPCQSRVKKFLCRGRAATGALPVKRPAENTFCRTILVGSHPPKPMVDQRGLPSTSPGHDRDDVKPRQRLGRRYPPRDQKHHFQ